MTACELRNPAHAGPIAKYSGTIDTTVISIDNLAHLNIAYTFTTVYLNSISYYCSLLADYSYFVDQRSIRRPATDLISRIESIFCPNSTYLK